MALTNYTELSAAVADWVNRTDLTSQIPDFIALADADIGRRARRLVTRAAITIDAQELLIPATVAEIRSLRMNNSSPTHAQFLTPVTPEMLGDFRSRYATAGVPRYYAVVVDRVILDRAPDQTYTGELIYYTKHVALTAAAPTNVPLTQAPALYLYGALVHAARFLEHDERVAVWQAEFERALEEWNALREKEEFTAQIAPMRLPVVFG